VSQPECAKSKGIRLLANTRTRLEPIGPSGDPAAYGELQASVGGAGPDGPKSEENSFSNKN
jgi:hypothetical protein